MFSNINIDVKSLIKLKKYALSNLHLKIEYIKITSYNRLSGLEECASCQVINPIKRRRVPQSKSQVVNCATLN